MPGYLTSRDLAHGRAVMTGAMDNAAIVQRPATERGSMGGAKRVYREIARTVCLVSEQIGGGGAGGGGESVSNDRLTATMDLILTLPYGTDIQAADRVLIGPDTYEVIEYASEPRSYDLDVRVKARQIRVVR